MMGNALFLRSVLFSNLQPGQVQALSKRRRVGGIWVFVVATRLKDDKLLVLITSSQPKAALVDYSRRWQLIDLVWLLKVPWLQS